MLKSIKYSSQVNINVYENGVLKNKFDIRDANRLNKIEEGIVLSLITNIFNEGFPGNFDKEHLKKIHRYLFDNIYYFAGEIRSENITKGDTLFCQFHLIDNALDNLFLNLKNKKPKTKEDLVKIISYYYSELNMIHPFREGNGRVSRIFFKLYARELKFDIDFENVTSDELLEATIYSVSHGLEKLEKIFNKIIN